MAPAKLTIATRKSPLAKWQATHVKTRLERAHPGLVVELVGITTEGDDMLDAPLSTSGGKGLFIKALEQALYDRRADIAVHSMKDVTVEMAEGLHLPVIMQRGDPRDALVGPGIARPDDLPQAAVVGTSSTRRRCQLLHWRGDLRIKMLRGNVGTRLRKLDAGEYDAIVLAAAGLVRLGLEHRISALIPSAIMLPAIGQAAIGIEARVGDDEVLDVIRVLDDPATRRLVGLERAVGARLLGGCELPIAVHAYADGDAIVLRGRVGYVDGSRIACGDVRGDASEGEALAEHLAKQLLADGAEAILRTYRPTFSGARPLAGIAILVTRPADQADDLCRAIDDQGGRAIRFPTIEIAPCGDPERARGVLDRLTDYDLAIFVSKNAVDEAVALLGDQCSVLDGIDVMAMGTATAAVLERVVSRAITVNAGADSTSLAAMDALDEAAIRGQRIVIVRGEGGREWLGDTLRARGATVDYAEVYRRVRPRYAPETIRSMWRGAAPDVVVVTSRTGLENLLALLNDDERARLYRSQLVVMGERLLEGTEQFIFPPMLATESSNAGILAAIRQWAEQSRS